MSISHYIKEIGRDRARAPNRAQAADLMGQILNSHVSDLDLDEFVRGKRSALVETQTVSLIKLPELPTDIDAATTARRYT
jgi:hypothetical protein